MATAPTSAVCGLVRSGARRAAVRPARVAPALRRSAPTRRAPARAGAARADIFGGVQRFFSNKTTRGEGDEEEEEESGSAGATYAGASAPAGSLGAVSTEVSAIEASLGLGPYTSSQTAAIQALLERADRDAATKAQAVPGAREAQQRSAVKLQEVVAASSAKDKESSARTLDENQARAEALMRGFADLDATGVIERLRVVAEQASEEVTSKAFGGRLSSAPRRAVITHAVAANESSSVTLSVRDWQPSERAAAAALQAELRSPEAAAAVESAEKLSGRNFPPLFRDYAYESS